MGDERDFILYSSRFRNRLMCTLSSLMESGEMANRSSEEIGQVTDMIKDLTEAEMYISKKKYYDSVIEAMEESEDYHHRMGYIPDDIYQPDDYMRNRWRIDDRVPLYRQSYNDYKYYKKHYTETHDNADMTEMKRHADNTIHDMVNTLRDIWDSSDPDLKHKMREDIMKVINETT